LHSPIEVLRLRISKLNLDQEEAFEKIDALKLASMALSPEQESAKATKVREASDLRKKKNTSR